jgi:hypothetical protein
MKDVELLEYMISNAVSKGIEQALEKQLKPLKEELAKVKALNAKILKEQNILKESFNVQPLQEGVKFKPIPRPSAPTQIINEGMKKQELEYLKQQAAPYVKSDGILPDVDIDPGMFLKKR